MKLSCVGALISSDFVSRICPTMSSFPPPKKSMSLLKHLELTRKRKSKKHHPKLEKEVATDNAHSETELQPPKQRAKPNHNQPRMLKEEKQASKKRPLSHYPFESNPKQRWTELTAVGHVLADEVHSYLHDDKKSADDKLSCGEQRQLITWSAAVEKNIYRQSSLVLENVNLTTELRQTQSSVQGLRDDLLVLRTQTRRLEHESQDLEEQMVQARKDERALQGASSFLSALQSLCHASNED